jgi:membrane-associated phospholipid phosphatase
LPGIDRWAVAHNSATARAVSNIGFWSVAGGTVVAAVTHVSPARARGNFTVLAEAISWNGAVTEWLKVAVHRARPAVYRSGGDVAARADENRESFPSSHTSAAFTLATAYATLAARQRLPHAGRNSLLLFAGASLVGALRVTGGKHFPTDVLAGAALGGVVGWSVATLHPMTH